MEMQEGGQPAHAAPAEVQGGVTPDIESQDGEAGNVDWQKRYSDSSREAKKLYEEKVRIEAEAKVLREQLGSLKNETSQQRPAEFPSKVQAIKSLVEHHGFDEKQAEVFYDRDRANWEQSQELIRQNQAMQNMIKFMRSENEQGWINNDPVAKEASEFCKNFPELASLPIHQQRDRYLKIQELRGVKVSGRDTTAAKMAAGGTVGGGARGSSTSSSASEEMAKSLGGGWTSKAYDEFSNVKTDADFQAWQKRHPNAKL